jgi:hypothetical protein
MSLIGGAAAAWPLPLYASGRKGPNYLVPVGDHDAAIVTQRLEELGYSDGTNLMFDFRSAEGQLEHLPKLAARLC